MAALVAAALYPPVDVRRRLCSEKAGLSGLAFVADEGRDDAKTN